MPCVKVEAERGRRGDFHMRKMTLIGTVGAVVVLAGVVGWIGTTTHAKAPVGQGINPSEITLNAKNLNVEEFVDYSFVFN
jgi:hypothetical protein